MQRMRCDADVRFRIARGQLERARSRHFDWLAELWRCRFDIHPGSRENKPDARVGRGSDGSLGALIPLTVQIEKFGDRRDACCQHFRERCYERPVHVFRRQEWDDAIQRLAAPSLERPIVGPTAQQNLIRVAVPVDEAGHDETIRRKRTRRQVRGTVANVPEVAGLGDGASSNCKSVIGTQLSADDRARALYEFANAHARPTSSPFLKTCDARFPPNCQPNSCGEAICNATKSAAEPARMTPACSRSDFAAARVTPYSASAAVRPKSLRPKYATV